MTQKNIAEIVRQLRKIQEERDLSFVAIENMLDNANLHLSYNTIRKVFEEDLETARFQEETIRSIADVLLNVYNEDDSDDSEIKGLKSTIKLQNIIIEQLKEHLDTANKALDNEQLSALRRVDFLRDRIEKQDLRIEQKDRLITILLMIFIEKADANLDSEYGELIKAYFKHTVDDVGSYLKELNPEE